MNVILFLSDYLIPLLIFYILGFALLSKRPVFDDFLKGAKEGVGTVFQILPTLIGLMIAAGVLRASGFLDWLGGLLAAPAAFIHLPAPVVPVALVRLISNSAAVGLVLDIFKEYGTDSAAGLTASVLMSCTETVFYCISIYFGTLKITKTRYTMAGALIATGAGMAASILFTLS